MSQPTLYTEWRTTAAGDRVRDLAPDIALILQKLPLTSWVREGEPAMVHKFEWPEEVIAEITGALGANIPNHSASATGITLTVAATNVFRVGDQIYIDGVTAAYQITAITPSTTLTVTEIRGVAVSSDASNGAPIRINRATIEGSIPADQEGATFPGSEFNYTQIFRKDVEVTTDMQKVAQARHFYPESLENMLDRAASQWTNWISYHFYRALHDGVRIERTGSVDKGYMGGLYYWLNQVGGNAVTGSGSLTLANLNDAAEAIYNDIGAAQGNLIMLLGPIQNQKMSDLLLNTSVYRTVNPFDSNNHNIGTSVAAFTPNITGMGSIPVVLDSNMPADKIYFLDTSKISIHPFQDETWRLEQYQVPGAKKLSAMIYGQYTLRVKNAKYAHCVINSLSTT